MKKCNACKNEKPLDDYPKSGKSKDGRTGKCTPCTHERDRAYREANKDKVRAKQRRYYEANREEIRAKGRAYTKVEPEAVKARRRESRRRWAAANPEVRVLHQQRRRARAKETVSDFTNSQWTECVSYFNNECAYCGAEELLQQEHVIPLSKGGGYTVTNIIPACAKCNSSKRDTDLEEWFSSKDFYSEDKLEDIYSYLSEVEMNGTS